MLMFYVLFSFLGGAVNCGDVQVKAISPNPWIQPYSPYWCPITGLLYMIDFMNGTIISYNDATKSTSLAVLPIRAPSFLLKLTKYSNQFLISDHLSLSVVEWDGSGVVARKVRNTFSVETDPRFAANNWNVAKASKKGMFLGGTFRGSLCGNSSAANAGLYSYNKCNGVQKIDIPDLKSSSGIAWNANGDVVYHVAACQRVIRAFDYDLKTGKLSNGRIVFVYEGNYGDPIQSIPLGLTIDKAGFLYVAIYHGGVVLVVDPTTGKIVKVITIPAEIVTAVEFGGKNLDKLFVCTASKAFDILTGEIPNRTFARDSGNVFEVTGLGATGVPQGTICI